MKNVTVLCTLVLLTSTLTFAQRDGRRGPTDEFHKDLSVEQLATLKTKKMTLALDLSQKQQQEIYEFNVDHVTYRKEKMAERKAMKEGGERSKPTIEERYALENAKLDRMIAQQQELKKILTDEQFDQWKKLQLHRYAKAKKHRMMDSRRG